jgi:ATP synthase protein I
MLFKKIPKPNNEIFKYVTLISQLGLTVIFSILICVFAALYFGKKFNISGILLPIGVILGVFAGVYSAYKLLKRFFENEK